jgi:hypothetical protein
MSSSTTRKRSSSQPYSQEARPSRSGPSTVGPPKDPRQQLNERVQKYHGPTTRKLKVECERTKDSKPDAQRWKCAFFLEGKLIGESKETRNKASARKDAAEKSLDWMTQRGFP